jgi:hypothetical protein
VPNPRRCGGDTGGPLRSVQLIVEGLSLGPPADMHEARIPRERPVFPGIGGKFVEREPDGVRGSCLQAQLGTAHHNTRTHVIGERSELSADEVPSLDPMPSISYEQVLIGCQRLSALGEAFHEVFGSPALVRDRVHDAEHVLGTMTDLAHQEVLPFLALFAFGNVLSGTDHADGASLVRGALEIRKPVSLHIPDLAVSPLNPVYSIA